MNDSTNGNTRLILGALQQFHQEQSKAAATTSWEEETTTASTLDLTTTLSQDGDLDGPVDDYIHYNNAVFAIQTELRLVDMVVSQFEQQQEEENETEPPTVLDF